MNPRYGTLRCVVMGVTSRKEIERREEKKGTVCSLVLNFEFLGLHLRFV